MMMDLKDVAKRVKKGERVSPDEFANLIRTDREAMMAFLIANNPGSMNNILRHKLGYTHELGFKPDLNKIQRIVQIILDRNNHEEIATIWKNFKVDEGKLDPQLKAEIQRVFQS